MTIKIMDAIKLTENEIEKQKKNLVDDLEELEDSKKTNEFLESVIDDYTKYQNAIIKQKKQQQQILLGILDYLDELNETQVITKHTLSHSKNEQKRLVKEIKNIQDEMDAITLSI
tara:strand:+ start:23 stop:367 length:345 start_codon:yes stop_codon:yes gene_type:complete